MGSIIRRRLKEGIITGMIISGCKPGDIIEATGESEEKIEEIREKMREEKEGKS